MQNIETLVPRQQKFVESTVVTITPDYARHLRDKAHFERQRKISPDNVKRLAREMQAGRFIPGLQIYLCVLPDGSERIVNGNHTLEAVAASGVSIDLTVTRAPVADDDEAGRVYAVFDLQKTRTWKDSLKAVGTGQDIPYSQRVLSAIGVIEDKFAGASGAAQRLARIERLEEYRSAACVFAECLHGAPKANINLLLRAPTMAVALETIRYQPSFGSDFWGRTALDDGLTKGMPEKAILNWMRNNRVTSGGNRRLHTCAAALAWNAAWRGEQRDLLRPSAMSTFFLLGTPHANGLRG